MYIPNESGAEALTVFAGLPFAKFSLESPAASASGTLADLPDGSIPHAERVRHLLFGTPATVQATIRQLHYLRYADPKDWSRRLSTGRANEVMAILTRRIRLS